MKSGPPIAAVVAAAVALIAPLAAHPAEQAIALVVTNEEGAFVADLERKEVQVVENGEVRPIQRFERDPRPLDIVLVLDTGDDATLVYSGQAYGDVAAFVGGLPPEARCTLWTTADRPRRVGELGGGPASVEGVLAQGFLVRGTTTLLDTLVDAAGDLERSKGRRRALVVVSSFTPGHTTWQPPQVMEKVRAPRARVLAVQYRSGGGQGGGVAGMMRDASSFTLVTASDQERVLSTLARVTGGRFEALQSAQAVGPVLRSFARELAGQYRVRYDSVPARKGRRVEVRLARPGVRWSVTVDSP